MIEISIAAVANQSFFVQLDERAYSITLHAAADIVTATVARDDVTLIQGARLTPGTPVLPYRYQESGNFILVTDAEELPNFEAFGITQFLLYLSADELAALRV